MKTAARVRPAGDIRQNIRHNLVKLVLCSQPPHPYRACVPDFSQTLLPLVWLETITLLFPTGVFRDALQRLTTSIDSYFLGLSGSPSSTETLKKNLN